jgi:hypothetical protein
MARPWDLSRALICHSSAATLADQAAASPTLLECRHQANGIDAMHAGSSSRKASHVETIDKIIYLRQPYGFGPRTSRSTSSATTMSQQLGSRQGRLQQGLEALFAIAWESRQPLRHPVVERHHRL